MSIKWFVEINSILKEKKTNSFLDVRTPVRNLADEIHNIQSVINALCFDTVEFDLSHISGEQVANGDLYSMEDLLEILTDVYHWIKNDEEEGGELGLNI